MRVASVSKEQAVFALRSEARKELKEGDVERARSLVEGAGAINRGEGSSLWEVYSNADEQRGPGETLVDLVVPHVDQEPHWAASARNTTLLTGAVGVGTAVASHLLAGTSFWSSVGLGAIPFGASIVLGFGGVFFAYDNDVYRPLAVGACGIGAGVAAGIATGNPWLAVGIGAGTVAAQTAVYAGGRALESRGRGTMKAIEDYSGLLKDQGVLSGSGAPPNLTRTQLAAAVNSVSEEAMDGGNFRGALDVGKLGNAIRDLSGDNFDEIYASALKKPEQLELLEDNASRIFKAAEDLQVVSDLQQGATSDTEVNVGDDFVEVGDVVIKRD